MIHLLLICLFGVISYILDICTANNNYYKDCINNINFHIILLIHHIIVIFIFFGWISNNKKILILYIITIIILVINWSSNNNRCSITDSVNKMCNLYKYEYIRDFLYLLGLKHTKYYDSFYKSFLVFSSSVVIYKLKTIQDYVH